jgi:acyl phosphate:glycerol-3-phosphate acyltransferase
MSPAVPIAIGYLLGSIPFALLLSRRLQGIDIRRAGSGNVGAANVLRTDGLRAALVVMLLDVAKGAGSVLIAQR